MNDLFTTVLQTEPALPIEYVGWSVLVSSLLITVGWMIYLYR